MLLHLLIYIILIALSKATHEHFISSTSTRLQFDHHHTPNTDALKSLLMSKNPRIFHLIKEKIPMLSKSMEYKNALNLILNSNYFFSTMKSDEYIIDLTSFNQMMAESFRGNVGSFNSFQIIQIILFMSKTLTENANLSHEDIQTQLQWKEFLFNCIQLMAELRNTNIFKIIWNHLESNGLFDYEIQDPNFFE